MKYGQIIGIGNTATVYEWENNKVLKLFHQGYPIEAVEREFQNVQTINIVDFAKPKAYELIYCEGRVGIIYDRIKGELLQDWAIRTRDAQGCAIHMAKLHKEVLRNKISNLTDYKQYLEWNILKAISVNSKKRNEVLNILYRLPDGNTLCHGDFHPGNIFLLDNQRIAIDFMNVCRGVILYDVARTVFLVQYTPVAEEMEDREDLLKFKEAVANQYLEQMNVTREMIQDYITVISIARRGECPNEYSINMNYE